MTRGDRWLLALASDEQLAREMNRGNPEAFEVAYERHAPGLRAMCRHILGSSDEAEEALQQSLTNVWAHLQRTAVPPGSLKPWLYAAVRNHCRTMLRARHPGTISLDDEYSVPAALDEIDGRAELRALLADIVDLPSEQRTALILSELVGLSHADVASLLGRRATAIKTLVFNARATLSDWREAREAPCAEVRQALSVLRGGALRRRSLRRHLQLCDSCRRFREETLARGGRSRSVPAPAVRATKRR